MNKFKQMLDQIRKAWAMFYANVIGAIIQYFFDASPSQTEIKFAPYLNKLGEMGSTKSKSISKTTTKRSVKRTRHPKKRVKR